MKKLFIILSFLSAFMCSFYAQTSQNMVLLMHLNEHYSPSGYSACWGYTAPNGREYAILGCLTGTAFVDITDTANIHEVDFVTGISSQWREMKTYSHYAYVVSEADNSRLQIIDLQYLPDSVRFVSTFTFSTYSRTHSISQSGPYLYLNGSNLSSGGVIVLDLTANPEAPVVRGSWSTLYVHDCRVLNDTIWACNINNQKVTVINAVNKDNLQEVTNWVNGQNPTPHNCAISADRKYIFVTDEITSPTGKMKVWNIQNLSNITLVSTWFPPGFPTSVVHNIEIYGSYAIMANYTAGVRVLDISNPANVTELGWYDTYALNNNSITEGCWGVYKFPSGKIIASDEEYGLFVLKTTFPFTGIQSTGTVIPENFMLHQNYPNPFNPQTKIKFDISNPGDVRITVYDSRGKEAETIVNENLQAGIYETIWNASGYPSGVYFCRLELSGNSDGKNSFQTKKMILVK